jgi:hypothetical protein
MKRTVVWDSPYFGITMYEQTERAGVNPCTQCYLREVCDSDECGRKLLTNRR